MPPFHRRTVLKSLGAGALTVGSIGTVSAKNHDNGTHGQGSDDDLRLFAEQAVDNSHELVTQKHYAYVATGDGFAVADWRNPGRPETVAEVTVPESNPGILDVKVDGDLLGVAYNGTEGARFYDVSDPTSPEPLSFYDPGSHIHNMFLADGYAYLTLDSFANPACGIVDVTDPENPTSVGQYTLTDDFPEFGPALTNVLHDVYVQDDYLYMAFWDAGVVIADVSDKSSPETVAQFGEAPTADEPADLFDDDGNLIPANYREYVTEYYGSPGNAHYVQPSPDGDYVYVGAETFPGENNVGDIDGDGEDETVDVPGVYGGIDVWDVTDYENPENVATIEAPDVSGAFRTSHNFDVTNNRLHSSWYAGGVRVHDITDPTNPEELYSYQEDGVQFWTAVRGRGFTLGGIYGAGSDTGGFVVLHADRGKKTPPGFDSADAPSEPETGLPEEAEE
jgi:hypothetical protein